MQIRLYASDDVAIRTEGSVLYDEGPHATVGDIYEFDIQLQQFSSSFSDAYLEYLKLSVCVLHENDPRIELTPSSTSLTSTTDSNTCLIPSQIKLRYKQLQIFIFKGEELPDDSNVNKKVNKTCQAYLKLTYMGVSYKTSVIEMKNDVIECKS